VPTKIEKDAISGQDTTGHEWDGVRELNTPLPKWWLYTYIACVVFAMGQFVLYPSIPYGTGYFHGLLGYSQRRAVDRDVAEVAALRAESLAAIQARSFAEIRDDPKLLATAMTAGRIAFAENCQPCHGGGGGGRPGYPALAAGGWIWGGKLEDIQQTLTHGIRSGDPQARESQMPKFGDGALKPNEIGQIADYVMTLYGTPVPGRPGLEADTAAGRKLFADNCAVCHGQNGEGNREMGAPRLASRVHLNAATRDAVVAQITSPRMGVMPAWNTRLDAATIKSLALYVHAFGGGE
jgi:cytochrome c oxidase cbb3-type subunit 3